MAQIYVLDKHTAELIAAGEVVERPASVAKELCENAVDAKATAITLTIEHGGISLLEVQDNGSGIDAECVPTAFLRHATSKVKTEADLESIRTLGFRGEALASIASVSKIALLTKTDADEYACLYRIEGGDELGIEAAARPTGTTITVRDLFYNTPARMKFLKKDASEGNYVSEVISHLALSHPEISFKFVREGKVQFQTPGDGVLMSAAYAVLTRDFARELIEVDYTLGNYRLTGLVTPPHAMRASRAMQFFFINGRYVKNRTMLAALENAYRGLAMQGKFPGCILALSMPPELVDVNVHPAKTEVRFARESEVFDMVYQGVKLKLLCPASTETPLHTAQSLQQSFQAEQQNTFTQPQEASVPLAHSSPMEQKSTIVLPLTPQMTKGAQGTLASTSYVPYVLEEKPFAQAVQKADQSTNHLRAQEAAALDIFPQAPEPFQQAPVPCQQTQLADSAQEPVSASNALQFIGEAFRTYIITQQDDTLCLIDKHAAHERLLYEQLVANYGTVASQQLLSPVTATLSAAEKNALLENEEILQKSGIEIEDFGGASVLVRAVPCDVVPQDIENLVVELAARLSVYRKDTTDEKTQWVLHSIACRAAIKAGDKTHEAQLLALAQDIISGKVPPYCPHGRPVILRLTRKELEKQFGRQG